MSLEEKVSDLRWHVATTGHADFAITPDYYEDAYSPSDRNFALTREPGVPDCWWIITCCGSRLDILDPVTCSFERRISEAELAQAGRPELCQMHGIAELVESIKLEPSREVPKAWSKVGELDIGDDDPV